MEDFHICDKCQNWYCDDCEIYEEKELENINTIQLICYNCYTK